MSTWSIPFDQLAAKVKLDLETVVRRSTVQLFEAVDARSPVRTGRFRGNWFPSIGAPVVRIDENAKAGDSKQRIQAVYRLPVGDVVYLTNSLPYAQRLEHGWSKQAPRGMVRLSAIEFKRFVRQAIRE